MNLSHTNRSVTVEFLAEVLVLCQALNMMFINKFMVVVLEPPHARAREGCAALLYSYEICGLASILFQKLPNPDLASGKAKLSLVGYIVTV